MTKDTLYIHNVETGEVIVRELTDEEQAQKNAEDAAAELAKAEKQAEEEAKATQRQALLDKLGITKEEAKLLLS
jgi:phosphosulfolactate phosphohydrolase-like enzyme